MNRLMIMEWSNIRLFKSKALWGTERKCVSKCHQGVSGIFLVRSDQLTWRDGRSGRWEREKIGSAGSCIIRTAITSLQRRTEQNRTEQEISRHRWYALVWGWSHQTRGMIRTRLTHRQTGVQMNRKYGDRYCHMTWKGRRKHQTGTDACMVCSAWLCHHHYRFDMTTWWKQTRSMFRMMMEYCL